MNESQIVVRECGSNPAPDDSVVQHIDMSGTGLFSRLGRIFQPEKPPARPAPRPQIPPAEALAQEKLFLAHCEAQLRSARAILVDNPSRPSSTAITAVNTTTQQYVKMLQENADIAAMPFADVPLLVNILVRPGEGLISTVAQRIAQLEKQTATPPTVSEEYRKLCAAEDKFFVAWAEARKKRRAFEAKQPVGVPRHEYKRPRATYGVDFGRVDEITLQRVCEMALAIVPESK